MPGYFETIGRSLRGVTRFSGRDTLPQFWPYAGTVIVLSMAAWAAIFIPLMSSTMSNMQRFAAEHPDQADVTAGPGFYSISIHGPHPELVPDFVGLSVAIMAITVIVVTLLASAVTRRLHDRGKGGYWALPPLIFLVFGLVGMTIIFGQFGKTGEPDMGLFGLLFLNNILYLGSLAALLFQLVQNGTKGPNRYGDNPHG